jgi:large subunit ribosomal protein L21
MYAVVKAGGRQEKVSVGDTLVVDRVDAAVGAKVNFPAVLLVDGQDVTADPKALASVKVVGEVLADQKGPKIRITRYKQKTGYRRRQGFRAALTRVKITGINK